MPQNRAFQRYIYRNQIVRKVFPSMTLAPGLPQAPARAQQKQIEEAFYEQYARSIHAYLRKHIRSQEEAEDILVEIFVATIEHPRFRNMTTQHRHSWIWVVARNKLVDHLRSKQRRPQVPLEAFAEMFFDNEEDQPEAYTLRKESYAQLRTYIQQLSSFQQDVLRLRYGHELSCGEIARHFRKTEGAIRMIIYRTLRTLREMYAHKEQLAS